MRYIKQLSTYTDLQTHISVQFPLSGLWHLTMFCKEKLYFIQRPRLWKIFFTFEILPLFSLLYSFPLKNHDFRHPFHWRNYETMDTWSPTRSQNTCERLSTEVLRKRWRIQFSVCIPMLQLSAPLLSRNWLESPLFCFECWVAPLYFYFPLGSVSSATPKK